MISCLVTTAGAKVHARSVVGPSMKALEPPYEMKFVVSDARAAEVAAWAAEHLAPDPHAGATRDDGYRVTSLYLDTPALDVYHRRGSHARAKFRVRRYDDSPVLFLERKCKVKDRVRKRRTKIHDDELERLVAPEPQPHATWPGRWFRRRVELRGLEPSCLIQYERVARIGTSASGPIRLTIDRQVVGSTAAGFGVPALRLDTPLFQDLAIVELKYRHVLPSLYKELLLDLDLGLRPAPASKYRAGVAQCRLGSRTGEGTDA